MDKHTRTKKKSPPQEASRTPSPRHIIINVTLKEEEPTPHAPFCAKHTRSVSATSPGKTGSVTVISVLFATRDDRGLSRFGRVAASRDFGFLKYRVASAVARDGAFSFKGSSVRSDTNSPSVFVELQVTVRTHDEQTGQSLFLP